MSDLSKFRPSFSRGLLPLVLIALQTVACFAKGTYLPEKDPLSLPENQEVLWRGDQRHLRTSAESSSSETGIFQVSNLRWTFQPDPSSTPEAEVWKPDFVDARIDLNKVRAISLVWSPFFPRKLAGHTGMLLEMDPGGLTLAGADAARSDLDPVSQGLVISVEARMRHGEKYGFVKGLRGKFSLVYSVSTVENYRQRCLDVYKKEMHRWRLTLSPEEIYQIAQVGIETSLKDHRQEKYNLTRRSCSTEFVDMLIEGLEKTQEESGKEMRLARIQGLQESLRLTRQVPTEEVEQAASEVEKTKKWWIKLDPRYWLGMTREHFRRTTPHGVFVNPMMSFPARLPGVLYRRGLLPSKKPYLIEKHETATKRGLFSRMFRED